MKVGLVRHFRVKFRKYPPIYPYRIFQRQIAEYDIADVIVNETEIKDEDWDICYCSTLPRAIKTAKEVYHKEIIFSKLLVEVPIAPFTKKNILLPYFLWVFFGRVAWASNSDSQTETKKQTDKRVNEAIELILGSGKKRILIVSHGFFMTVMARHLRKRGYSGIINEAPRNGKLYIFRKEE